MDKQHVIQTLRAHESELHAAGIVHLSVFGSVARGEASEASDVDLLAEFDMAKRHTLVSLGRLESQLSEILGVKVDLSSKNWLKEPVRKQAVREAVLAF